MAEAAGQPTTARAVRFLAPYRVEVAVVDLPAIQAGQLRVRSEFTGISAGTEMLVYRGEVDPSLPRDETLAALAGTFAYPLTFGYSAVGTVEASRCGIAAGERVFAFHPHQDVFVVEAEDVVPVGTVDPRTATLLPLVETALQLTLDAGIRLGERVVVLGLGAVGILTAILLARSGGLVVGADTRDERREVAAACGVDAVAPAELPAGVDVVVEATGNPDALGPALPLLRSEGVALVASWYGSKPVTLPLGGAFHRRRLEIRSSQVSTVGGRAVRWDRGRRLELVRGLLPELPLAKLATHTFPFDRAPEAYAAVERGEDGLVHAALSYA
jgi:2-desacetyl-2-hydroxyethyl bacteriochlorophyllide A dehydrogenase